MSATISGLLVIVAISAIGGWLLTFHKAVEKPVKVLMFVGYFWLLAFIQLLLVAVGYYFWQKI